MSGKFMSGICHILTGFLYSYKCVASIKTWQMDKYVNYMFYFQLSHFPNMLQSGMFLCFDSQCLVNKFQCEYLLRTRRQTTFEIYIQASYFVKYLILSQRIIIIAILYSYPAGFG